MQFLWDQQSHSHSRHASRALIAAYGTRGAGWSVRSARGRAVAVELLDEFEAVINKYLSHRCTLQKQKEADMQREDNMRPGWLVINADWAENGSILNAREIQSEYWSIKSYSLFISIAVYLVSSIWNDTKSALSNDAEVTIEHENGRTEFGWVVGGSTDAGEDVVYTVRRRKAGPIEVPRRRLRHRVKRSIAFIGVTDEKRHDAPSSQHFFRRQLEWWSRFSGESFHTLAIHTDNATHFKSNKMFYWWSTVFKLFAWVKRIHVDFGCPGHGKGPWDGLGAVVKTQIRRDLLNGGDSILTASKKISSPAEVAEQLRARFSTQAWQDEHKHRKVNEMVVFYSGHDEITERVLVEKSGRVMCYVYFTPSGWPLC